RERAVQPYHDAPLAADVSRAARVTERVGVGDPHGGADREARRGAGSGQLGRRKRRHRARERKAAADTRLELLRRDGAVLHEQRRDPGQPVLVVRRGEIVRRVHTLDGVTEPVHVAGAAAERRREDGALPLLVEDRLVRLDLYEAEAVHAAQVVDPVHPVDMAPVTVSTPARSRHRTDRRFAPEGLIRDPEPGENAPMIDFTFPPDVEDVRQRVREFMTTVVKPAEVDLTVDRHDPEGRRRLISTILELRVKAKEWGLWLPHMPAEIGGMGLGPTAMAALSAERART